MGTRFLRIKIEFSDLFHTCGYGLRSPAVKTELLCVSPSGTDEGSCYKLFACLLILAGILFPITWTYKEEGPVS